MSNSHTIAQDLRKLAVETGHLAASCLGCGYERSCSIHGCALIDAAADALERSEADWQQLATALANAGANERRLSAQLRESEAARTDLAKRLAAAQRELHETKSDVEPVRCDECIYMQGHETYMACDKLNYGVDLSSGYCSAGRRRNV